MFYTYRKIDSCVYEVGKTGYYVEHMEDGMWDAYLLSAWGDRLWSSPCHKSRDEAARSVFAEIRRINKLVQQAIGKGAK